MQKSCAWSYEPLSEVAVVDFVLFLCINTTVSGRHRRQESLSGATALGKALLNTSVHMKSALSESLSWASHL